MPNADLRLVSRKYFGFGNALRQQVSDFESKHPGLAVSLDFLEVHDLYEQMIVKGGCKKGDYDMMLVLTDWIPQLNRTAALWPINSYIEGNPPEGWPGDWTPSLRKLQTDAEGNFYGLAYHDGPEVFHYRSDLFGDQLESKEFQKRYGRPLGIPKTWTEFLEVAKFFTRPKEGLLGTLVAIGIMLALATWLGASAIAGRATVDKMWESQG
jgi:multiple sugar transport system substrate-binding protein